MKLFIFVFATLVFLPVGGLSQGPIESGLNEIAIANNNERLLQLQSQLDTYQRDLNHVWMLTQVFPVS